MLDYLKYIVFSYLIAVLVLSRASVLDKWNDISDLSAAYEECHQDLHTNPRDFTNVRMRFPWLAFLQYVRIKDGLLYHGRVPRVVLVHRQYVLTTTADATEIPEGYSLGNIVFKDYDRDEEECGVDIENIRAGAECLPSELVMPIADVILHPEYYDDDTGRPPNGIAILKMMRRVESNYMVPICFPFLDYVKAPKATTATFVIDFDSKFPETFIDEQRSSEKVQILPKQLCDRVLKFTNVSESHWALSLCTSGCGRARGAPLVSHLANGWWVLVALASRSAPCTDPAVRGSSSAEPSVFVSVLPYVDWITNVTTEQGIARYTPKRRANDPFGYSLKAAKLPAFKWVGRVFLQGPGCFQRPSFTYHYYQEIFKVRSDYSGDINYFLNLQPGTDYKAVCVKVQLPYRFVTPNISGIGHWNMTVWIPGAGYKKEYDIVIDILAVDPTQQEKTKWVADKTAVESRMLGLG